MIPAWYRYWKPETNSEMLQNPKKACLWSVGLVWIPPPTLALLEVGNDHALALGIMRLHTSLSKLVTTLPLLLFYRWSLKLQELSQLLRSHSLTHVYFWMLGLSLATERSGEKSSAPPRFVVGERDTMEITNGALHWQVTGSHPRGSSLTEGHGQ